MSLISAKSWQIASWTKKFSRRERGFETHRHEPTVRIDTPLGNGYSAHQALPPLLEVLLGQEQSGKITKLLHDWRRGDREALDTLLPIVYKELQRLAHFQLRQERPDHTLQSAALVNEAYLRLVGLNSPQWESRSHFFAIAAQLMRQILVDYARRHRAGKRGAGVKTVSLDDSTRLSRGKEKDVDVVALDDGLRALAQIDPRKAQVVELRFFGGLSYEETAKVLKVSAITVSRDWSTARAWLHREIRGR